MDLQQPLNEPLEQEVPQESDVNVMGDSPVSDHDVDPFMENLNKDPAVRPEARGLSENGAHRFGIDLSKTGTMEPSLWEHVN